MLKPVFLAEWPYSTALIIILLCHEMGHYLAARYYGVKATLPYFIPFPMGPVGTMGAVIRIKEPIPDKQTLFDIGAAGPLASLILSCVAWIWGVYLSDLIHITDIMKNNENVIFFGDSLFTYWSAQLIKGPFNPEQMDLMIHPLAKAGWVGLLITSINLLPFGQLDGGHVIYAMFGENYRKWIYYYFILFLMAGLISITWLIWGFILFYLIKIEHPYIPDHYNGISKSRIYTGYFLFVSFLLTFIPVPVRIGTENGSLLLDIFRFIRNFIN